MNNTTGVTAPAELLKAQKLANRLDTAFKLPFIPFRIGLDAIIGLIPGLGDAGAHVSQIMDAGWSSFMLSHWCRETGFYSVSKVIKKMTSEPARVVGLDDRGLIKEGMRADINVFDIDEVAELQPELVNDFPGGAPRFIQKAKGFKATIVNGEVSLMDGELTGTRAGKVLRSAASA